MSAWVFVFLAMFVLDFVWAKYTKAVTLHMAISASWLAVGITLCNAIVTVGYVNNLWLLVPTLAGAWCGTWCAVKHSS